MYSLIDGLNDFIFDDFFPTTKRIVRNVMRTDVYEKDGYYHLDIELPGYKKEEVNLNIANGYLTVGASHSESKNENDSKGNLVRRERDTNACSRSFKIGMGITAKDVKAKFENGVLHIELPSEKQKAVETKETIAID